MDFDISVPLAELLTFPAASVIVTPVICNGVDLSVWPSATVYVAVYVLPVPCAQDKDTLLYDPVTDALFSKDPVVNVNKIVSPILSQSEDVALEVIEVIVGATISFIAVSVAAAPTLPATSVNVTERINVPSFSPETSTPVICWVAELIVPLPVTVPTPPELLIE